MIQRFQMGLITSFDCMARGGSLIVFLDFLPPWRTCFSRVSLLKARGLSRLDTADGSFFPEPLQVRSAFEDEVFVVDGLVLEESRYVPSEEGGGGAWKNHQDVHLQQRTGGEDGPEGSNAETELLEDEVDVLATSCSFQDGAHFT